MGTSQVIAPNPAQKHNPDHMAGVYVMPLNWNLCVFLRYLGTKDIEAPYDHKEKNTYAYA